MIVWFWTIFVGAIILWYILVTTLVGFKGAQDIRDIFKKIRSEKESNGE